MLPLVERQTVRQRLRWRFDFAGSASKFGIWDDPGPKEDLTSKAWCHNREGLVRACIEAKEAGITKVVAECDGWDFVNFQWMAAAKTVPFFKNDAPMRHFLLGLKLITRDYNIEVFPTGEVVKTKRPESEKQINFATFGK